MSAIGHYLEAAGLPTVQVSLIREHTASMKSPRALWVPYELGRPLGVPGDAAFQKRVLRAALSLLDRTDGPLIIIAIRVCQRSCRCGVTQTTWTTN